eukprot:TRINITY_DN11843_c0_g1_i1.p1 TRINITY_DN11843_c0_g1~~TRINITY_DN11843_c0_g1_i1.p1  ORF type:complete len:191 (+),score=9.44 TRINITY_DN11843_c0_g1_i1:42-614(+)
MRRICLHSCLQVAMDCLSFGGPRTHAGPSLTWGGSLLPPLKDLDTKIQKHYNSTYYYRPHWWIDGKSNGIGGGPRVEGALPPPRRQPRQQRGYSSGAQSRGGEQGPLGECSQPQRADGVLFLSRDGHIQHGGYQDSAGAGRSRSDRRCATPARSDRTSSSRMASRRVSIQAPRSSSQPQQVPAITAGQQW